MTGTVASGRGAWVRVGVLAGLLVSFASACGLETGGLADVVGDVDVVDDGGGEIRWDDGDGWRDDVGVEGDAGGCGDGLLDPGEACDDGNASDNDACVSGCVVATCGDGFWWSGMEECDAGAANSDTAPDACRTTCRAAFCGDGVVDSGEGCDDGNTVDTDGCRNTCIAATCGDGVLDAIEECDDGAGNSDTAPDACRTNCLRAHCGDGVTDAGEGCDAGAANSDTAPDACRTTCRAAFCGDGVRDTGERCDAGAANSNVTPDACRTDCTPARCGDAVIDTGEACDDGGANSDTTPDACRTTCVRARCGDGVVDTGEACDDGNTIDTDACRNTCARAGCGDGVVGPGEACDDGNGVNTDACLNSCVAATCGDGFVWAGAEDCDRAPPRACTTSCASTGSEACVACRWAGTCVPPVEVCNGLDDDCASGADNGFACVRGASVSCATTCGSTGSGACTATCTVPGPSACTPPAEVCNGLDDDCIGGADNGFACARASTVSCTTTCGSTGSGACTSACAVPAPAACTPPGEVCNGLDDDCVSGADNGFACVRASTVACTTACGSAGSGACTATCTVPGPAACTAPAEACNGLDDDCDTACDNGFACCAGTSRTCATTCGSTGSQTCTATCALGACSPPGEICNGLDDDCVGGPDNGFACIRGASVTCTTTCGTAGTGTCTTSCALPAPAACTPPVEICNGADDDCDTLCDEGFGCCAGAPTACAVGSCTGTASCSAGCVVGACNLGVAPANDTCAGATSIALPGGTFTGSTCPAASDYNPGGGCGVTGARDVVYRIALPQRSRVVASTVGSAFDTVLYVRSTDCAGGAQVACDNDGGGGGASRIDTTLDAGVYYLFLDGDGPAQAGAFSLNVQIAPANDTCAGAIDVGAGGVFTGTTLGAANDYSGGCGDVGGADVVYALTVTGGSDVFITTVGSAFDTVLYLVQDSCTGSMIACTDDYRAPVSTGSILIRDDQGAGTYYIVVDGKTAAARGDYRLEVSVTSNDDEGDRCGQPFEFDPGAFPMRECDATNGSGNEYSGGCGGDNRDEIYYVVIPVAGSRTFTTCHATTNFNTVLYLRSACADSGSQIGCNNDDGVCPGGSNRSTFTASLTPGIYYLFVDGQGAQGDYCVEIL